MVVEYLTCEETAQVLRTSRAALYHQRYRGALPGALGVQVGKRILWRRSDVDSWFEEQRSADAAAVAS